MSNTNEERTSVREDCDIHVFLKKKVVGVKKLTVAQAEAQFDEAVKDGSLKRKTVEGRRELLIGFLSGDLHSLPIVGADAKSIKDFRTLAKSGQSLVVNLPASQSTADGLKQQIERVTGIDRSHFAVVIVAR